MNEIKELSSCIDMVFHHAVRFANSMAIFFSFARLGKWYSRCGITYDPWATV